MDVSALTADATAAAQSTLAKVIGPSGDQATVLPAPTPPVAPPAAPAEPAPTEPAALPAAEPVADPAPVAAEPAKPVTETVAAPVRAPEPAASVQTPTEQRPGVVQQVQPANINVSVRLASPGDNGPVTQVNAAVAASPLMPPATAPTDARYQSAQPQYQPLPVTPEKAETPPASQPVVPATAIVPERWDWTWTLGCGDDTASITPMSVETGEQNWNWTWNWNCGDVEDAGGNQNTQLPTQYQPVVTQYQPLNVNVSIRIGSPGNDGSVTQANIAVGLGLPPVPPVPPVPPAPPASPTQTVVDAAPAAPAASAETAATAEPTAESAPTESVLAEGADPEDVPAPTSAPELAGADSVPIIYATDSDPDVDGGGVADIKRVKGFAAFAAVSPSTAPILGKGVRKPTGVGDITAPATLEAPVSPTAPETQAASAASSPAAAGEVQPQSAPGGPKAPLENGSFGLGLAVLAPPGASDRNFGVLAVLLFLFVFFVDAARRVTGVWSPPSAELGRRPERPG